MNLTFDVYFREGEGMEVVYKFKFSSGKELELNAEEYLELKRELTIPERLEYKDIPDPYYPFIVPIYPIPPFIVTSSNVIN